MGKEEEKRDFAFDGESMSKLYLLLSAPRKCILKYARVIRPLSRRAHASFGMARGSELVYPVGLW